MGVNAGSTFEIATQEVLELLGFLTERNVLVQGSQIDILARSRRGGIEMLLVVECKDQRTVSITDVRLLAQTTQAARRTYPTAAGLLISRGQVSKEGRAFADATGIHYSTLAALENQVVDLGHLARYYRDSFHQSVLSSQFVPLNVMTRSDADIQEAPANGRYMPLVASGSYSPPRLLAPSAMAALDAHRRGDAQATQLADDTAWIAKHRRELQGYFRSVDSPTREGHGEHDGMLPSLSTKFSSWVSAAEPFGLLLLGDYGTGKTSSIQQLASFQGSAFLREMPRARCPVVLLLKNHPMGLSRQSVLEEIQSTTGLRDISWPGLVRLMIQGRLVFMLDGLDEMGCQIDSRVRQLHFASITRLLGYNKNKVLISGRPGYFPENSELKEVLDIGSASPVEPFRPEFESCFLAPFSRLQIEDFVDRATQSMPFSTRNKLKRSIATVYNLQDLARRPVLLNMIVETMPELARARSTVTPAKLYEVYTRRWLERDYAKGDFRWLLKRQDRVGFMTELAWRMQKSSRHQVHFSELANWIRGHFHVVSPEAIDYLAHDIQTCSFLRHGDDGFYTFVHRSFMEYFFALRLVSMARGGGTPSELVSGLPKRAMTTNSIAFCLDILGDSLTKSRSFVHALVPPRDLLASGSLLLSLPEAVRNALGRFILRDPDYKEAFGDLGGKSPDEVLVLTSPDGILVPEPKVPNQQKAPRARVEGLQTSPDGTLGRDRLAPRRKTKSRTRIEGLQACSFCGMEPACRRLVVPGASAQICDRCIDAGCERAPRFLLAATAKLLSVAASSEETSCSFCRRSFRHRLFSSPTGRARVCVDCLLLCRELMKEREEARRRANELSADQVKA